MTYWTDRPTTEAFDDALRKGFGRAVLWAARGFANHQPLLDACLNDLRYDRQVELPRGDWLCDIVDAGSFTDSLRQPLLDAICAVETSDAPEQLCQLARHFADRGDEDFRQQLERIVLDRPVSEMPWLGDGELIQLDGEEGFLMAVRRRVAELKTREWDWFDSSLIYDASEILGGECVAELLETESSLNDGVKEFYDAFTEDEARLEAERSRPLQDKVSEFHADDVIAAAEGNEDSRFRFRGWGRYATAADLERVFDRMLQCDNLEAINKYLQVFARRAWPRFDRRILELCEHEDAQIRRRAATAIAFNRHPDVRKFALARLGDPVFQESSVEMLLNNYEPGDERTVMEALVLPNDAWPRHDLLMSLRKLLEENPEANCNAAAQLIYEETPCSMCRHGAVELLLNRGTLPLRYRDECRFDVDANTRELVDGPAWPD